MSAARSPRRLGIAALGTLAPVLIVLAILAAPSQGASLSKTAAFQIFSTGIAGDTIYWFQRDVPTRRNFRSRRAVGGRVMSRKLGSEKVTVAYKPPAGMFIRGFNVRGGRIAVGLTSIRSEKGRSAVYELTPGPTELVPKLIAERFGTTTGAACGQRIFLTNIDHLGRLVLEDVSYAGVQGKCVIVRRIGQFKRFDVDGATTDLSLRDYGWTEFDRRDEVPDLLTGPGDWVDLDDLAYGFLDASKSYLNLQSGKRFALPTSTGSPNSIEFSTSDTSLANFGSQFGGRPSFRILRSPTDFEGAIPLKRAGSISWFHVCGAQLLEISRRKATRRKPAGSRWNLYLRDMNGNVTRRLKERVVRASAFDACDAKLAVFHTERRRGTARQFTVPLG